MKYFWFTLFLSLLCVISVNAQINELRDAPGKIIPAKLDTVYRYSSRIDTIILNKRIIENLTNLGLVWGFLKYHHPSIAKGTFNWDAELFRVLPNVLAAKDKKRFNKILEKWIDNIGLPEKCINCSEIVQSDKTKLLPDYGNLFKEGNLSAEVISKLKYILTNRNSGRNKYVHVYGHGWPDLREETYAEMIYPDAGYRLLGLYRFWNCIQYFYPNRHLFDEGWSNVLNKFIPKFLLASDSTEYGLSCMQLAAKIQDSHAMNFPRTVIDYFGRFYSPLETQFVENKLVVTKIYLPDPVLRQNIKVGDVITRMNGKPVTHIVNELSPFISASNYPTLLRDMRHLIFRGQTPEIILEIEKDGQSSVVKMERISGPKLSSLNRDPYPGDSSFKLLPNGIGYIYPAKLKSSEFENIKRTLESTRGIILDYRCYPSDSIPPGFLPWFKPDSSAYSKFSFGNVSTPGLFTYEKTMVNGQPNPDYYKGKVVVIVNETTQSRAEHQTMIFQTAPKVTVIGSTTAGAMGTVSPIFLPGNIKMNISGIGVYYPDGKEVQRVGVRIDVPVKATVKGIREGRDELMEKAIELIERQE